MKNFLHTPVLLDEAISGLNISASGNYIDATLGGGGHTKKIIQSGGRVLGIDQDRDALEFVGNDQKENIRTGKLKLAKGNFRDIYEIALEKGFGKVDGILFDLGVSSYQLDSSERGFSIRHNEKLDMRMDNGSPLSAYEVVNKYSYERLVDIFYRYGEEHNAREIAKNIVEARKRKNIETTGELALLVEKIRHKSEAIHPATRVFQAIRIEVNDELNSIKKGLDSSCKLLNKNGRIAVISFHSLEDRIVKQAFTKFERDKLGKMITKKPISATFEENKRNKRSRSAKLRILEII